MKIDKGLTILSVILILLLGAYFIARMYQYDKNPDSIKKDIQLYNTLNYDHFKLYQLDDGYDKGFKVSLDDTSISYKDNNIKINDNNIINSVSIINKIGLYDDLLIMFVKDNSKNYIIKYNITNNQYNVVDSIDDMNIVNIDDMDMYEAGYDVYLSKSTNDGILINGVYYNPCDYKENVLIKKHIVYFYDIASKDFNSSDIVDQTYLNEFKKGIC